MLYPTRRSTFATLFLLAVLGVSGGARAADPNNAGLQISVAADLVGQYGWGATNNAGASQRFDPREAELLLQAPIDSTFDGRMSLAAHREDGKQPFELHEMYLETTKLVPRSRIKAGQFFLGVGRLNQVHRHDWPFTSAPRVHQEFFKGVHGALDTGAEYGWLTPLPFYLDVTVGLTNGWIFGHSHDEGRRPLMPTHYLRVSTYQDVGETGGVQVGLNYLGRRDSEKLDTQLFGLDALLKLRHANFVRFSVQAEAWHRHQSQAGAGHDNSFGFYAFPNYGFNDALSLGVRFDGYSIYSDEPRTVELSWVPTLTWHSSEFATFRLSYKNTRVHSAGQLRSNPQMVEAQMVFLLGTHPAHDF